LLSGLEPSTSDCHILQMSHKVGLLPSMSHDVGLNYMICRVQLALAKNALYMLRNFDDHRASGQQL